MGFTQEDKLYLSNVVDETLNDVLCDFYDKHNIKSGDITPEQSLEWDDLKDKVVDLMLTLAKQNSLV